MNAFPLPEWLHLSEVPAYVAERMGSAPLDLIVRAIHDGKVRTRARCRSYMGHETQVPLDEWTWDDATVDWQAGSFSRPGDRGRTHTFDKVDVLRAGVLGLDWWLDLTPAQPAVADPPPPIETSPSKAAPTRAANRPKTITESVEAVIRRHIAAFPRDATHVEIAVPVMKELEEAAQPAERLPRHSTITKRIGEIRNATTKAAETAD